MDTFQALQHDPGIAILRGGFVILYRHGRWYFIASQLHEQSRRVKSVAVLSPERAQRTLAETPSAIPKKLEDLGTGFIQEIERKVLATPDDYLPLFRSRKAAMAAGVHTDQMEESEYSQEQEAVLLQRLSRMMNTGVSSVFVTFKDFAL